MVKWVPLFDGEGNGKPPHTTKSLPSKCCDVSPGVGNDLVLAQGTISVHCALQNHADMSVSEGRYNLNFKIGVRMREAERGDIFQCIQIPALL